MKLKDTIILMIFLAACMPTESTRTDFSNPYFDTTHYLEELFPNDDIFRNILKTITYNGTTEVLHLTNYDMTDEIQLLKSMNINNPNWVGKYDVDTIIMNNQVDHVAYRATDPDLIIQSLKIHYINSKVTGFEASYFRKSLISTLSKYVYFDKNTGYKIQNKSEGLFVEPTDVIIEIKFSES